MSTMLVKIDGEFHEVNEVIDYGSVMLRLEDGTEWYVFLNSTEAGEAARKYWEDLAQNDPREFTCMVGEETLISWALGQSAGPGYAQVRSLDEWLDLWLNAPEDHFASYDGCECYVEAVSRSLLDELDWTAGDLKDAVAYRHN